MIVPDKRGVHLAKVRNGNDIGWSSEAEVSSGCKLFIATHAEICTFCKETYGMQQPEECGRY